MKSPARCERRSTLENGEQNAKTTTTTRSCHESSSPGSESDQSEWECDVSDAELLNCCCGSESSEQLQSTLHPSSNLASKQTKNTGDCVKENQQTSCRSSQRDVIAIDVCDDDFLRSDVTDEEVLEAVLEIEQKLLQ